MHTQPIYAANFFSSTRWLQKAPTITRVKNMLFSGHVVSVCIIRESIFQQQKVEFHNTTNCIFIGNPHNLTTEGILGQCIFICQFSTHEPQLCDAKHQNIPYGAAIFDLQDNLYDGCSTKVPTYICSTVSS